MRPFGDPARARDCDVAGVGCREARLRPAPLRLQYTTDSARTATAHTVRCSSRKPPEGRSHLADIRKLAAAPTAPPKMRHRANDLFLGRFAVDESADHLGKVLAGGWFHSSTNAVPVGPVPAR